MNDIVQTKIYLDQQFEISSNQDLLKNLKMDVIVYNQPQSKSPLKLLTNVHINSVFLYFLAYVLIGLTVHIL